jgi:hypothetical protein
MEQSPSEANGRFAAQDIPGFYGKVKWSRYAP